MLRLMKSSGLFLAALLLAGGMAGAKDEFLRAEQAFSYLVAIDGHCLTVQWNVAPGYYLYKSRMGFESATPGVSFGEPLYPKGEIHHDEYFGDQEIFRDDFKVSVPLQRTDGGKARAIRVKLKIQGCADAGLCFPPTVWDVNLPVTVSPES